jgi:hypothetical protein
MHFQDGQGLQKYPVVASVQREVKQGNAGSGHSEKDAGRHMTLAKHGAEQTAGGGGGGSMTRRLTSALMGLSVAKLAALATAQHYCCCAHLLPHSWHLSPMPAAFSPCL